MKWRRLLHLLILFFFLTGCTPGTGEPAAVPSPSPTAPVPADPPPATSPPATATRVAVPVPTAAPTVAPETVAPPPVAESTAAAATMTLPVIIADGEPWSLLLFTRTAGFRHASIADGIAAIEALGVAHGFDVVASEDPALFTDQTLAGFRVVAFLSTTGNILDDAQQAAFERYIQNGGAFVGIHAATDTEYEWPWYGSLVGAYFANHPAVQDAVIDVVDGDHPSTHMLPDAWNRRDEWYNFGSDPSDQVNVLLNLDESSYSGGAMGASHPIAWYHEYDGGRSWYTAGGHTRESFSEPLFVDHVAGGILWAAGVQPAP